MTLKNILEVYASGGMILIGTENSNGWWYYDRCINLYHNPEIMNISDREVIQMFAHEGREETGSCCEIEPNTLVIIITGDETSGI